MSKKSKKSLVPDMRLISESYDNEQVYDLKFYCWKCGGEAKFPEKPMKVNGKAKVNCVCCGKKLTLNYALLDADIENL